jgi:hypothetical protein
MVDAPMKGKLKDEKRAALPILLEDQALAPRQLKPSHNQSCPTPVKILGTRR